MRIFKLTVVLIITIICFLALLHFKISFGIALFASMALMAFGINYVRKDDAETDEAEPSFSEHEPELIADAEENDAE